MKRMICLGVFLVLLIGCAAQEEKKGYWGEEAYSVTKVQDGVYKITIRESAETGSAEVGDAALIRCADAAMAHGFSYFEFIDRKFLVIQCYKEMPADASATIYDAQELCSPAMKEERK
jgi:hypothetical protein